MIEAFSGLKIQDLLIADPEGKIVWGGALDPEGVALVALPEEINRLVAPGGLLSLAPGSEGVAGVVSLETGPLLAAVRPILTSRAEGPARGTLIMTRRLDEAALREMSEALGLYIAGFPPGSPPPGGEWGMVRALDGETMAGYALIRDRAGEPVLGVEVRHQRDIYARGVRAAALLKRLQVLITVLFAVFFVITLHRQVLGRLKRLSRSVRDISRTGDFSRPIFLPGTDELAGLAGDVNLLLEAVTNSRRELLSVVEDQKETVLALEHRLELESFLADFSLRCLNLAPGETDAAFSDSLARIGTLIEADRSYVFRMDHQRRTMDNTHEWCAPGVSPQKDNLQRLPRESFPWLMERLDRMETIFVPEVSGLPPAAASEAAHWAGQGIHSLLIVPISTGARLTGFLGFDAVREGKTWSEQDRQVLSTLANTFSLLIERTETAAAHEALQTQLIQSQKMESVGRLAGGVAHDFNNILMVITGYAELMRDRVPAGDPLRESLQEILGAGERAVALIRQLLAFARRQASHPVVLDLNLAITDLFKMLRRLIGEGIGVSWKPGERLWRVKMDPGQLDQILVNLAVNARDALVGTGELVLETANAELDREFCAARLGLVPGEYVRLTVADNGPGMEPEIAGCIFEPFFTTKGQGEGTGLGLATVYGIVTQNSGFIEVSSAPGAGTKFDIYLPRAVGEPETPIRPDDRLLPGGQETVLLVEDEESVLKLAERLLRDRGYEVLSAGSPFEGMEKARRHRGEIQLLVTDVIMPGMNGRELAQKIAAIRPGIKTLFISGYTAEVLGQPGILEGGVHLLQKPFTVQDLSEMVRRVLDA